MIFGLFGPNGKIEIKLNQFNYHPGDTVQGTVQLTLKEAVQANGVSVTLRGILSITSGSGNSRSTRDTPLMDVTMPLDGEKQYTPTQLPIVYPFKIIIPPNVIPPIPAPATATGMLGEALKIGQMLGTLPVEIRQYRWELKTKLDIRMGLDLSQTVQLNVT